MSSPASANSCSPFFPRSPVLPRTPDAAPVDGEVGGRAADGCSGDAQGANKGGRCAPLEFSDGQHMCFFCFKMMPREA